MEIVRLNQRMSVPTIDYEQLWEDITVKTCQWSQLKENSSGISRLSLSEEDKKVRDWFVAECKLLGCEIKVDRVGNIFAVYTDVLHPELSPIGMGSHLDTQPMGGRFDGILGVVSALGVLRAIKRSGYKPYFPLAAVNWTNEEGARYLKMCMGSGVWCGQLSPDEILKLKDIDGKKVLLELEAIGYNGPIAPDHKVNKLSAHFELHIEQGPKLEEMLAHEGGSIGIGIVQGIQAMRWYQVEIEGQEGHAGALEMVRRHDALVAASRLVLDLDEAARATQSVATVGRLIPKTIAPNTIVGKVDLIFDCRAIKESQLDSIIQKVESTIKSLSQDGGYHIEMRQIWAHKAVTFNEDCIAAVEEVLETRPDIPTLKMFSAAGHDSASTASVVPTTMIFVPSVGGISHNPAEFTTKDQCKAGAEVLLESVLGYDKKLKASMEAPGNQIEKGT